MRQPGFEPKSSNDNKEARWREQGTRMLTYRPVFILQTGAGDGAAVEKDPSLGWGHSPATFQLVIQERVLPKDKPSCLPVVDNVALWTDRQTGNPGGQVMQGRTLHLGEEAHGLGEQCGLRDDEQ